MSTSTTSTENSSKSSLSKAESLKADVLMPSVEGSSPARIKNNNSVLTPPCSLNSGAIDPSLPGLIPCCVCGTSISAILNPEHMCWPCLERHVDIAAPLRKPANRRRPEITLKYCKKCQRYLHPPGVWIPADHGSPKLLSMCLGRVKGLQHFNICEANFISPETDIQRLRLQLVIESKDLVEGQTCLRRSVTIDYIKRPLLCSQCHQKEAQKDYWRCIVQLRQHTDNKCTYEHVQHLIGRQCQSRTGIDYNIRLIKPVHGGGCDYYFAREYDARIFVSFLESLVPVKVITSCRFISCAPSLKIDRFKYTWSVEIAPVSCYSLVCLSMKLRQQFSHFPPICLINRVSAGIHLLDPWTCQKLELTSSDYFRNPFDIICQPKQLLEYIVMDIETLPIKSEPSNPTTNNNSRRSTNSDYKLCDIWLVRSNQLGSSSQNMLHARCHLGHDLDIGDSVWAYNLKDTNINGIEFEKLKPEQIPDIVVVRKWVADLESDDQSESHEMWKSSKKKSMSRRHLEEELMVNVRKSTTKLTVESKSMDCYRKTQIRGQQQQSLVYDDDDDEGEEGQVEDEDDDDDIDFLFVEMDEEQQDPILSNSWMEWHEQPLLHFDGTLFQ